MKGCRIIVRFLPILALSLLTRAFAQPCNTLGQTPATAFPVCGTSVFNQTSVPACVNGNIPISPPCPTNDGLSYQDLNPYWYRFTCFTAGTLGFRITPVNLNDDYDWQLFDITGANPNIVYNTPSSHVAFNWSGLPGVTGASSAGTSLFVCGTAPGQPVRPLFSSMPTLVQGHTYLLMISHFTGSDQSGYGLSFGGGTAVITDPTEPKLSSIHPDCDGRTLRVKLNKKMKCSSLTGTGSEFSISPAVTTVASAVATNCNSSFDFDELTITLNGNLPNGNYRLVINNGTDGNSLRDNCDRDIPAGDDLAFFYAVPQPIFADSVGKPGCAPDQVKIFFPKRITCASLAADGSDFAVTGPAPVTVIGASANCVNGLSDTVTIRFASPIYNKGDYTVLLRAGTDGSTVIDECNIPMPQQSLTFRAEDTVSAEYGMTSKLGCRQDTLTFTHNGAHDVNKWSWTFNNTIHISTPGHTMHVPAASITNVKLVVTNGVCIDSVAYDVVMDNEVKAGFEMPPVICPEDLMQVADTSRGLIDSWQWSFGNIAVSTQQDPAAVQFPQNNIESYYKIKLIVTNNALNCIDSAVKTLRVLNNCFIAVPTAFTPNNDGLNDYLYPNNALKAVNLEFKVYNRWGQLVFQTKDWTKKWDGKIGGIPQAPGVFVWHLKYTHITTGQIIFQKGTTTLIR